MIDFDSLLIRSDPDRRRAALFAPAQLRIRLYALYAFYHEVRKAPVSVSEPMIGEMKLAWAREAVTDLYADPPKVRRHDVYKALSELRHAPGAPSMTELIGLIEAHAADLGKGPFPTRQDRCDYVDGAAVALMRCCARLLKPDLDLDGRTGVALTTAGRLSGFVDLIRAFAPLTQVGRPPLTADELTGAGLTETDLAVGRKPGAARMAFAELINEARKAAATLSRTRFALPVELFPAVGHVRLAHGYLKSAARIRDPYREQLTRAPLGQDAVMIWASLTGRI